jgi:hypothetical protein
MARSLPQKPDPGNGLGLHYSRFRRYSVSQPHEINCLHPTRARKSPLPAANPRRRANPYGLMFDEITASSLVKIDIEGNGLLPLNQHALG